MRPSFPLENAAVKPKVLQERTPLDGGNSFLRSAANVDRDGLAFGILGNTAKAIVPPVLEDQSDRVDEAWACLFLRTTLTVRAGHFWAVRDHPLSIVFANGRELVMDGLPRAPTESVSAPEI